MALADIADRIEELERQGYKDKTRLGNGSLYELFDMGVNGSAHELSIELRYYHDKILRRIKLLRFTPSHEGSPHDYLVLSRDY